MNMNRKVGYIEIISGISYKEELEMRPNQVQFKRTHGIEMEMSLTEVQLQRDL